MRVSGSRLVGALAGRARRVCFAVLVMAAVPVSLLVVASAATAYSGPAPILQEQTLLNAPATGCLGTTPGDHTTTPPPCPAGMRPKYDLGYIQGFNQLGQYGYVGTASNVPCQFTQWGVLNPPWIDQGMGCEWGSGPAASMFNGNPTCEAAATCLGAMTGDTAHQQLYRIDSTTDMVQNLTPNPADYPAGPQRDMANTALDYLGRMLPGIRSVVVTPPPDQLVIYTGGVINNTPGSPNEGVPDSLGMIAINPTTGRLVAVTRLTNLVSLRVGTILDGHLYLAGRYPGGVPGTFAGGGVFKWVGTPTDPFHGGPQNNGFENVMLLSDLGSANDPYHIGNYTDPDGGDHLILLGASSPNAVPKCPGYRVPVDPHGSGIWMSPVVPKTGDGLTLASEHEWKDIFTSADFDPDPVRGGSTPWGYFLEFHGQIVVGNYTTPSYMTGAEWCKYRGMKWPENLPSNYRTKLRDFLNSERAISVFAIKDAGGIGGKQHVRLLYGDREMPVYEPSDGGHWVNKENLLHQSPQDGPAGFGNPNNYYTWTMAEMEGKLYVSTFDGSTPGHYITKMGALVFKLTPAQVKLTNALLDYSTAFTKERGGDLVRFDSLNQPAALENNNGYGNTYQYGIRAMMVFGNHMYVGTAGMSNLKAGFTIDKLTPQANPVGPVIRRAVGQRTLALVMKVLQPAIGALPSQASPVRVRAGLPVDFRVKLHNNTPFAATGSRICVHVPSGFSLGSNPGAKIKGREVCLSVGKVPGHGSRTVTVHTVAATGAETGAAVATGSGSDLVGDPACASSAQGTGSAFGGFAEAASVGGHAAQTAASDPCPDLAHLSSSDQLAELNDFRVFARPVVASVVVPPTPAVTG